MQYFLPQIYAGSNWFLQDNKGGLPLYLSCTMFFSIKDAPRFSLSKEQRYFEILTPVDYLPGS
jgi:hypothetical protein